MGFQPILHLMRSPGSWSQWVGKLRPGSEYSVGATASQGLSRRSSSELSELSQVSGDTWSASLTSYNSSVRSLSAPLSQEAFNLLDQDIIRREMSHCRYGLGWHWLNPKSRMRLQLTQDERLQFSGYQAKPKAKSTELLQGDCQQLALQLGQRLHQRFQGKYKFYLVAGNYPQSPWRAHYFLVGWPAHKDAYFLEKARGPLHPFTKQPTARIPKEAFLIDPTYQLMGFAAEHDRLGQYIAVRPQLVDISQRRGFHKSTALFSFAQEDQVSPGLPLGFAKDLYPEHDNPEAVAFAYFRRTNPAELEQAAPKPISSENRPATSTLQLHLGWGNQNPQIRNWRQTVPMKTPLYQMLSRLEAEALKANLARDRVSVACLPSPSLGIAQRFRLRPSRA